MQVSPDGQFSVLLIDDDPHALELNRMLLLNAGIGMVLTLSDSRATLPFLEQHDISLVVLDLMMPHVNGAELLPLIHRDYPHIPVIVETAASEVETAVRCMKSGAIDYLVKPVEPDRLVTAVKNALNFDDLLHEVSSLKNYLLNDRLEHAEAFAEIKTTSRKMRSIFQYAEVVASSPQPVLITGETGVGKELFARSIHRISGVRGEFVSVNVAGLDDAMFSDTLFGHKKGAFTGADQFRDGLVSKAGGGTLFLDEIGDLNELSQVKLLRLLQEREYYPVGADTLKTSTARIVLATNIDLEARIKEGRFRRDLYYRLCTHQIHIPALRERPEDIPLLLATFIEVAARHFNKRKPTPSPELISALVGYAFPGNVRELHARVFDAVARHNDGMLSLESFPGITNAAPARSSTVVLPADGNGIYNIFGRLPTFREIENYLITEAMKVSGGSQAVAASMLGVTRQTISNRLKSLGN
ncbi:sigma-54 dependent transcriptional regulator [Geobacter sp. SVR]|uniref:sigma-54-dependent transcriptional regulator n=1 Tax=Geobacter sp. SVR TaxID=2495594 RepID=UPI00143EF9A3|nr:sigma-54 dependent transcriptional regulator [Geobacter sp. SVR]BCS55794.1 sigma-54-dependent Fis family transcriptional regulator [Geobacter sp. SVR]GCF83798.1 sigma-54-dependent Fis family transcriptional regulator [Geobacter sp. SVR]